jgi:hypothetical protein
MMMQQSDGIWLEKLPIASGNVNIVHWTHTFNKGVEFLNHWYS